MGLATGTGQIAFVGSVRLLAGRSPDTAIVVVALSLANRQLTFQRVASGLAAGYDVEVDFRRGDTVTRQVRRDERVVVGTQRETVSAEESAIFQDFIRMPVGEYTLQITVRDQHSTNVGRYETSLTVPALMPPPSRRRWPSTRRPAAPTSPPRSTCS